MPGARLNNGRAIIDVSYSTYTDGNRFVVSINSVTQISGACDVYFTQNSGSYYSGYSGDWYETTFRMSNIFDPDNGYYKYLDTSTEIYFDRNTGSTSSTNILIKFSMDGLPRNIQVTMPALSSYTVAYYQGNIGGSVWNLPSEQTKFEGVQLTLSSSKPSADYGTFQHWNTYSNDNGTSYSPGARYNEDSPLHLYAIWKLYTYRITFNANGGSGAPSSVTKTAGETLRLPSEKPTRNYYTFKYWTTNQNDTGYVYRAGASYTENVEATLYAQWDPIKYLIHYNANGGSGEPDLQYKYTGETITLSEQIPYRTGYNFKKWNTDSEGSGTSYNPGAEYSRNEDIDLFAIWELQKYIISFDANGGSSAPSNKTKTYGETLYLPDTIPRRTGYTFRCWTTLASGSGYVYEPGGALDSNTDLTLYAQWDLIYYTITYYYNYGTDDYWTQSKPYGETVNLSSSIPYRMYYTFDRWNSNSSGTGTNYQPGAEFSQNKDLELYAKWTPDTYEVIYNPNGGSGAPDAQTKTADVDLRLSNNRPVRSGYTFTFWSTSSDGRGTSYNPGDTYTLNASLTLYAIWLPGIFYDANGGSGAPSTQAIYDTNPIRLSTSIPVRDNHTFLYWNTNRNGTGTRYDPGDYYTPVNDKDNVFLYAIWRRDPDRPTISSMLVTRRNANNVLDDEGTYLHIRVTWNVDTVRRSGNTGQCKLYYKLSSNVNWTLVYTSSWSTSATSTKLVSGVSTDEQYDIKAVVVDADGRTTERIDVLTRAKFIWDIADGGNSMGIGSAAPATQPTDPVGKLGIGWDTQFDENVTILKSLLVTGQIITPTVISAPNFNISHTTDGIITSSSYWTVSGQVVYLFGPICSINITLSPSRTYEIGEVNEMIATIGEAYRPIVGHSFGTYWGLGYITTRGEIHFQNYQVISDTSQLQIGLTYICQETVELISQSTDDNQISGGSSSSGSNGSNSGSGGSSDDEIYLTPDVD